MDINSSNRKKEKVVPSGEQDWEDAIWVLCLGVNLSLLIMIAFLVQCPAFDKMLIKIKIYFKNSIKFSYTVTGANCLLHGTDRIDNQPLAVGGYAALLS